MNAYFDAVQAALENYGLLLPDPGRPVTEPAQEAPAEGEVPQPLRSAMRYSLLRITCCGTTGRRPCPSPVRWK